MTVVFIADADKLVPSADEWPQVLTQFRTCVSLLTSSLKPTFVLTTALPQVVTFAADLAMRLVPRPALFARLTYSRDDKPT